MSCKSVAQVRIKRYFIMDGVCDALFDSLSENQVAIALYDGHKGHGSGRAHPAASPWGHGLPDRDRSPSVCL